MEKTTGFILAGGQSVRMGMDKGFVKFKDDYFIKIISKALQPLVQDLIIVSPNQKYDAYCHKRLEDLIPNKGPVGGILTALSYTSTVNNVILSVDIPLITSEILIWLMSKHQNEGLTQISCDGINMPLIAIYNKSLLPLFKSHLEANKLKLNDVISQCPNESVEIPTKWKKNIQNINSMQDLNQYL